MDAITFAQENLGLCLTYFQKELLLTLQYNPEPLIHYLKPHTHDIRVALGVFDKWREYNAVLC